jgi:head-tail adaptor
MAYSSGMLTERITIAKRVEVADGFGRQGQTKYEVLGEFYAAKDFNRGVKALREGAFDAYDVVMFRMRYNEQVDRWCLIKHQDKWYRILSFNDSKRDNQIQITAEEMAQAPQLTSN